MQLTDNIQEDEKWILELVENADSTNGVKFRKVNNQMQSIIVTRKNEVITSVLVFTINENTDNLSTIMFNGAEYRITTALHDKIVAILKEYYVMYKLAS